MRPPALARLSAGLCLALCLGLSVVPGAQADPDDGARSAGQRAVPSEDQVARARARAAARAADVHAIKAQLELAGQRLEQAAAVAEQAAEAYNGAVWRLGQARQRYRAARVEAARAQRAVATQRERLGGLVAQSYQEGGDLSALTALMSADGPEGVLDQYAAFQGAWTSLQADYQRFAAADSLARVFEAKARAARKEQARLAARARRARARAVAGAAAAQREAAAIATEKDRLVRQLAQAQDISVSLARRRQTALEEIARRRAAERARRAAVAAARAEAAREARAAAAARQRASQAGSGSGQGPGGSADDPGPEPAPQPGPEPGPDPSPDPVPVPDPEPPSSSGGADEAVAFAKEQLGEPYRWGAAGPDSWDCSGLTMGAWATAGTALPHYSVAQYSSGVPISVADLQPGDLVFWSSNGQPSGIHHVALYIGGGQVIHAPRPGRPVEIDSMYYWVPPTLFVRV